MHLQITVNKGRIHVPGVEALEKQVGIMTELHIQRLDTYPFGDDSLIPIGVDVELYHQNLLAHSHRLFDRHSDKIETIRVLSDSGGELYLQRSNVLHY
jgi:hypothetical protein